ncbi:hypothetical protein K439DRAFT_1336367, partial [Ramaria rubella]
MQEEIDAAAAHVMALTLTDEGPDVSSQPSRLQNPPSDNVVHELETKVAGLCAIVRSVSCHTPSINKRKEELEKGLTCLEAQITEIRAGTPQESFEPIQYNSGHLLASPIDRLDEVAQITMFLAVVCTIIMGVSHCAGDFILGIMSVLLSLA